MKLNDLEYFETQGVNVLVYNNLFTGGFNDEKTSGIELIHHGVRTAQGGAVRLSHTPEQWDLVPAIPTRTVDSIANTIESVLRYEDYDFDSRVIVSPGEKVLRYLFTLINRFRLHLKALPDLILSSFHLSTGTRPF